MNALETFLNNLNKPDFAFACTLAFINEHYSYSPQAFKNGEVENAAGQNEGSCKTLSFALLENLTTEQALRCFGEHYRDVLATPDGQDHANIRALIKHGLAGVVFSGPALVAKG